MKRTLLRSALLATGALTLAACSMPNTTSTETAVHFGGGPIEAHTAKGCVKPSTREINSVGDKYYYYPMSQSTYDFTGKQDSDAKPITVVSSDNQTLSVPGSISFDLNTNCKVLTEFHNAFGDRYHAYLDDDGEGNLTYSDGWRRMMGLYIGRAADSTLDRVAKKYTWRDLYSNPQIKDEMNQEVNKTIATLVGQQMRGDDEFFENFSALIQQPQPGTDLVKAVQDEETGRAQAAAAEAKAVADANAAKAAADAQVAQKQAEVYVAQKEAERQAAEIAPYGSAQAYNDAKAIEKGLNPYQPTYGGSVTAQVPGK
jgi:regulator of protease activity HflC (stomatin/prohibitin superfamily)